MPEFMADFMADIIPDFMFYLENYSKSIILAESVVTLAPSVIDPLSLVHSCHGSLATTNAI